MYSLREEAKRGLAPILERLGRIGYVGVESAGLHDLTPAAFKRCLADAGLVVSSGHVALPKPEGTAEVLDQQDAIGNKDLVVAFTARQIRRRRWRAYLRGTIECLQRKSARAACRSVITITGGSSRTASATKRRTRCYSGCSTRRSSLRSTSTGRRSAAPMPPPLVAELGDRVRFLHVKDGPADDPGAPMVAVGAGVVDIPAILRSHPAAEWHLVELDRCATDMYEAVAESRRYLPPSGAGIADLWERHPTSPLLGCGDDQRAYAAEITGCPSDLVACADVDPARATDVAERHESASAVPSTICWPSGRGRHRQPDARVGARSRHRAATRRR